MQIRNIAIIAHVDHGKTTLTDALLRQTGMLKDVNVSMDSNDLERERGITIYAKNTSLFYKDTKINIVDTPGHADFGSEVERVLRSIDCVLLIVDAQEGPMPQTRFVLKKSLELGLKPIVVLNKIDKPAANVDRVHDEVFELFMELGATDEQLDFTTVYAIGRDGVAKKKMTDDSKTLDPLLDTILEKVPAAAGDSSAPLLAQPFNLAYDNFLGRMGVARIYQGTINMGQTVFIKKPTKTISGEHHDHGTQSTGSAIAETRQARITKLYTFEGTNKKEVQSAGAGEIVMIAGISDIYIGETICENADQTPLPSITIDEPTISLNFLVNDSPFAGREGKYVTTRQIRDRLEKELEINVGLRVDFDSSEYFKVFGRGELHVAVLLENMRREGFEIQVSQPEVIIKEEAGKKMEPFEEATIDVPDALAGTVIEKMGKRKGLMSDMKTDRGITRMLFGIPTRGLLGFRNQFVIDTKGEGILSSRFIDFKPFAGVIEKREVGSMVSMENGKVLGFSLGNLQERGVLYIGPGTEVYAGMVIGNTSKGDDLDVNPTKGKQLTNMRASGSDDTIYLTPPLEVTIERGLELMNADEYLEVTPSSTRLRKKYLNPTERAKYSKK